MRGKQPMQQKQEWDGFPLFGRDRDGWHLLRFENEEYPTPMWWDWHSNKWFADPESTVGMAAEVAYEWGYSYVAGTVTPGDLEEALAEAATEGRRQSAGADAERLNWIGNQDVIIGTHKVAGRWEEVALARYQKSMPADLADIRLSIDAAMEAEQTPNPGLA